MEFILALILIVALVGALLYVRRSKPTSVVKPQPRPRARGGFDDALQEVLDEMKSDTPAP